MRILNYLKGYSKMDRYFLSSHAPQSVNWGVWFSQNNSIQETIYLISTKVSSMKKKWQLITVIYQSVWSYYTEFYFLLYFFGTRFSFDRCATDEREMCVTETDNYHLEVIMYMYMKSPFHKFVFTKHIPKACSHPIKSTIKHWKWSTKHPPPLLTVPGWRHSDLWHRKWPFSSCLNCS